MAYPPVSVIFHTDPRDGSKAAGLHDISIAKISGEYNRFFHFLSAAGEFLRFAGPGRLFSGKVPKNFFCGHTKV